METQVKYKHFNPNGSDHQLCSSLLSLIDDLAPSDSYVQAIVDKVADGTYKTMITVKAVCGRFTSESFGFSPLASLRKAQKLILTNIEDWKKERFDINEDEGAELSLKE